MAKSQTMGTSLTLMKKGSESANTVLKALTSIGEISGERDEIDVTTLDSPNGAKEYILGATDWGELSVDGYVDDATQMTLLRSLFNSSDIRNWEILTPSKNKMAFSAMVKTFTYGEKTTDGVESFSMTLKISGDVVFSKVA